MEFFERNGDESIRVLVDVATNGYYPLFEENWIDEIKDERPKKLTINEKSKVKTILKRISKVSSINDKRTFLHSLELKDRNLFVKSFFKTVENKILDKNLELQ